LLRLLLLYQFFHWFAPSEAYFSSYVLRRVSALDNDFNRLNDAVFMWDMPANIIGGMVVVMSAVVGGERAALLLCAAAEVATRAVTLSARSLDALVVSQVGLQRCMHA
jgi:hypothetical protein